MEYEYIIRTDLAIQNKKLKKKSSYNYKGLLIKKFYQNNNDFVNIMFNNVEIEENKLLLKTTVVREFKKLLKKYQVKKDDNILIVGLGNKNIVSDSLGVKTVGKVKATGYLKEIIDLNVNTIYTYIPGVLYDTGYMAFKGIKALVKELKINIVIIVDSLICDDIKYLNRLVQISDVGITPGSGICNYQEEISFKTLKIPVLAIGVPTVTQASTIIKDVLKVNDSKIKFREGYDLVVAKKDIDVFINDISLVLSRALNELFK